MSTYTLLGSDTIQIGNITGLRVLNDFGDGTIAKIEFPEDVAESTIGKNGNVVIAFKAGGRKANLSELKIIKGSQDDQILQGYVNNYLSDPSRFLMLSGLITRNFGDGKGNVRKEIYDLEGGIIKKIPDSEINVSGETQQAYSMYTIIFAYGERSL